MKKILDILLIVLVTVLIVNYFNSPDEKALTGNVLFSTSDNSYTIPASVALLATNQSAQSITFNTCKNITLSYAGNTIVTPEGFCRDIIIDSGTSETIEYEHDYALFEQAGDYTFKINLWEKEYISQFNIDYRGSISKLFIGIFYAPLYNVLVFLLSIFGSSLGFAIVAITVLIRILLLYPQHKMMVSQKKLQAIQPKIKKIQQEFKGQQQVLGVKLMELYKKEKVNPMGSCGFLLIQMPILIVVYNIILSITDHSNYYHIYTQLSHFDMTSINYNFFGLDLLSAGWVNGAILALSVAGIQFLQIKLSLDHKKKEDTGIVLEKKEGDDKYSQFMPDPAMMNKFMLYGMPAMVLVFTFSLIAGVGIYWGISTLFMLLQQLFVNKIIKK